MQEKVLSIKKFESWHRKHTDSLPCDNPLKRLKGFVDIETEEFVYCPISKVFKSEYFTAIFEEQEKKRKFEEYILDLVRSEIKKFKESDLPEVRMTARYCNKD